MKNMSFALTTKQIQDGTKSVTRRIGWLNLKAGDMIQPVLKGMGLKKGEKVTKLREPIRVKSVRRERLDRMLDDIAYGRAECIAEGFADMNPHQFVTMFCKTHRPVESHWTVTRIEFEP